MIFSCNTILLFSSVCTFRSTKVTKLPFWPWTVSTSQCPLLRRLSTGEGRSVIDTLSAENPSHHELFDTSDNHSRRAKANNVNHSPHAYRDRSIGVAFHDWYASLWLRPAMEAGEKPADNNGVTNAIRLGFFWLISRYDNVISLLACAWFPHCIFPQGTALVLGLWSRQNSLWM